MKYFLLVVFIGISLQAMEERQIKQAEKYTRMIKEKSNEAVHNKEFLQAMSQFLAQIEQEEEIEKRTNSKEENDILFYNIFD